MSTTMENEDASLSTASVIISNTHGKLQMLISDNELLIFQWVVLSVMSLTINILGLVTNIINIICFTKQGFKDPVNISLLGLAVSDLGGIITLMWTNLCFTPAFQEADLPFDPVQVHYVTSGMPHVTFARVSGWITALITLERCLCITMPLKVKVMITPNRVLLIIICIFIFLTFSASPPYVVNRLEWTFFPDRNKTLVGLVYAEDREMVEKISFAINYIFLSFTSFMVIIVCTVTLVIKLHTNSIWRKTSAQVDNISIRNQKAAKMVTMISTLFIFCFIPMTVAFVAISALPEFSLDGKYRNVLVTVAGLGLFLESMNSSVNIFIYYHMSSKYKTTFRQIFGLDSEEGRKAVISTELLST